MPGTMVPLSMMMVRSLRSLVVSHMMSAHPHVPCQHSSRSFLQVWLAAWLSLGAWLREAVGSLTSTWSW
jgi:hypothetical protein